MGAADDRKDRGSRDQAPPQRAVEAMAELRRVIEELFGAGQRITPVPTSGVIAVARRQ